MSASLVGKKLGKYEITGILGQGGMASVYLGHQQDIDRDVAIKVLPPHPGQDSRFVERFRLEARTIARLQHPHILPVYDYGDEDGILYLVMAYVRGGSLADRIRKGAMSPVEAERLMTQMGSALDYAHRQNIVHRDVKPANILIDHEGHALLTDFGIVKLMEGSSQLTGTGGLIGTPAYMSPEQAQSDDVDHRSDLYSLGVVGYEMLTGKQPFHAETPMQIVLKQISAPPALGALNMPFARVIGKALAKSPDDRYQTVADFVADFRRAARGEDIPPGDGQSTMTFPDATLEAPYPAAATGAFAPPPPLTGAMTQADAQLSAAAYQTHPDMPATGINQPPTGSTPPPGTMPSPTGYPPTSAFASDTQQPGTTTIIQQQTTSPLILLGGFAIIAVLIVVVVLLTLNNSRAPVVEPTAQVAAPPTVVVSVTSVPSVPTFGRVRFSTTEVLGDTVSVRADNFAPPPAGTTYHAWLINTADDQTLHLGVVRLDPLGAGMINFTNSEGQTLPTVYDALVITAEETVGDTPSERVVYRGSVPALMTGTIRQILLASDDGINGGSLIDGALAEAEIARQHSGLAARATSVGSMRTHAEHTINILRGREGQEDLNGDGRADNPGRGFGVPYFLDRIDEQLTAVTSAPEATVELQNQIELIRVCILNARGWMDTVLANERELIGLDSVESAQSQNEAATYFANALIEGIDLNENGQVEPFEGECGLRQITEYGVAVSNFSIVAGTN